MRSNVVPTGAGIADVNRLGTGPPLTAKFTPYIHGDIAIVEDGFAVTVIVPVGGICGVADTSAELPLDPMAFTPSIT